MILFPADNASFPSHQTLGLGERDHKRPKCERIIVFKNMFDPKEFEAVSQPEASSQQPPKA